MTESITSFLFNGKRLLLMRYLITLSLCFHFCASSNLQSNDLKVMRTQRQSSEGSSALKQITDDFAILARLANGIFIQEGLSDGSVKSADVIAELLNISSGDTVRDLSELKLDVNGASSILDNILSDVNKLGNNPLTDSKEVSEGFTALDSMKDDVDDFAKGNAANIGSDFLNEAENFKSENIYQPVLEFSELEKAVEYLTFFRDASLEENAKTASKFDDGFKAIIKNELTLQRTVQDLIDYEASFKTILNQKHKYQVLDPLFKIARTAQAYSKNWNVFSSLSSRMKTIETDGTTLLPIIKQHDSLSSLSDSLKPSSSIVNALLTPKSTPNHLTESFPNGAKDLALVKEDLKRPWLKEKIAEGKDVKQLTESMSSIQKFSEEISKMSGVFNKLIGVNDTSRLLVDTASMFQSLAEDGKYLSTNNDLSSAIQTISSAMANLKQIKGNPPVEDFLAFYNHVRNISETSVTFERACKKIIVSGSNGIAAVFDKVKDIAKKEEPKKNIKTMEAIEAVRKMREIAGFNKLVDVLSITVVELRPIFNKEFTNFVKNTPSAPSIVDVQGSLEGTNLADALKQLKEKSVKLDSIDKMLKFGMNVRKIKSDSISSLKSLLKIIGDLITESKNAIGSKTRHRRAEVNLKKLKETKSLTDLGKGVNILRKLIAVRGKSAALISAVDNSEAIFVFRTIPDLKLDWTEENLKKIKDLPVEVEKLELHAQKNKDEKDLIRLGSIFTEASVIQGAPIDSNLLKEQAVPALQKSSNPTAQNAAPTFSELSELQLDYSKHSITLKAAAISLNHLRAYFDEMFGIKRTSSGEPVQLVEKEVNSGISFEMLLYIGVGVFLIGAIVGSIIYFYCKYRKNMSECVQSSGSEESSHEDMDDVEEPYEAPQDDVVSLNLDLIDDVDSEESIMNLVTAASDEVLSFVTAACMSRSSQSDFMRNLACHSEIFKEEVQKIWSGNKCKFGYHHVCNKCGKEVWRNGNCCGVIMKYTRVGGATQTRDILKQHICEVLRIRNTLKRGEDSSHNLNGEYFKKLWTAEREKELKLSLLGSIDGVSLKGNTKKKIWPITFMIIDLPTMEMQRASNIILHGIVDGSENPSTLFWNTIIDKVYTDIENISFNLAQYTLHCTIVSWVADQPAKRSMFGMRSCNSESSCFYGLCKGTRYKTLAPPRYIDRFGTLTDDDAKNGLNGFGLVYPKIVDYLYPYDTVLDLLHNGSEGLFQLIMKESLNADEQRRSDLFMNDHKALMKACESVKVPPEFTIKDMTNGSEKITFFRVNLGLASITHRTLSPKARLAIVSMMVVVNQMYSNASASKLFHVHLTAASRWSLESSSKTYMATKAHELLSHLPYALNQFGNIACLSTFGFEHFYKFALKGFNPQLTKGFIDTAIKRILIHSAVRREMKQRAKNPSSKTIEDFLRATPQLKPFRYTWKFRINQLDERDMVITIQDWQKFSCLKLPFGKLISTYKNNGTTSDIFFAINEQGDHACYRFICVCVEGDQAKILAERIRRICTNEEYPLFSKEADEMTAPGNTYSWNVLNHLKQFPGLIHGRKSGEKEIICLKNVQGVGGYLKDGDSAYYLQLNGASVHH